LRPVTHSEFTALATVAVCVCVLVVAALAFLVDTRALNGATVWAKPMKFAVSFGVHLLTLVWFVSLVSPEARGGSVMRLAVGTASIATLIEVLYVMLQASRGRASHFNTQTAWESFLYYQVMGGAALALIAASIAVGIVVLRSARADNGPGLRLGAGLGALVGALATLVTAGAMAAGVVDGPGHWVGSPKTDAFGLPLVGWSTVTGDLRVPHFFATHLTQALPALGLLGDRIGRGAPLAVVGGVIVGLVVTAATFAQAIAKRPFVSSEIASAIGLPIARSATR
jgi:hypothetical protein